MSSKDRVQSPKHNEEGEVEMKKVPSTTIKPSPTPTRTPLPTTSKDPGPVIVDSTPPEPPSKPWTQKCWNYIYNKEKKLFCDRTCRSWWYMFTYSIMYLIFLCTYTMIFLYATLTIIKMTEVYTIVDKSELMTYSENGIGLTAVPTATGNFPLISYTEGQPEEYDRYVRSIDELLVSRRKRAVRNFTDLGPCGVAPYGYGDEPCVIVRINKQFRWSAKPLYPNSTKGDIPKEVAQWIKLKEQKLWLHCTGCHSYDQEHIGSIKYYPYPPGYDPDIFPLNIDSDVPLIAIQISKFSLGMSLAVECKLWYDGGPSSTAFILYVEPKSTLVRNEKV